MSEIKSEKAKQILDDAKSCENSFAMLCIAYSAVHVAEAEVEERHAKELQELKDKAVEAHRKPCYKRSLDSNGFSCGRNKCDNTCNYMQNFLTELNK